MWLQGPSESFGVSGDPGWSRFGGSVGAVETGGFGISWDFCGIYVDLWVRLVGIFEVIFVVPINRP